MMTNSHGWRVGMDMPLVIVEWAENMAKRVKVAETDLKRQEEINIVVESQLSDAKQELEAYKCTVERVRKIARDHGIKTNCRTTTEVIEALAEMADDPHPCHAELQDTVDGLRNTLRMIANEADVKENAEPNQLLDRIREMNKEIEIGKQKQETMFAIAKALGRGERGISDAGMVKRIEELMHQQQDVMPSACELNAELFDVACAVLGWANRVVDDYSLYVALSELRAVCDEFRHGREKEKRSARNA